MSNRLSSRRRRAATGLPLGLLIGLIAIVALTAIVRAGRSVTELFSTVALTLDDPCATPAESAGSLCKDGMILIGMLTYAESDGAPGGSQPLYTTRCDLGRSWDPGAGACVGAWTTLPFTDGVTYDLASGNRNRNWIDVAGVPNSDQTGMIADKAGKASSAILAAADSNAVEAGVQPHLAAQACESLNAHGRDDWYLPSAGELHALQLVSVSKDVAPTLHPNLVSGSAACSMGGAFPCQYHSSTEFNPMAAGASANGNWFVGPRLIVQGAKNSLRAIRCVRRG